MNYSVRLISVFFLFLVTSTASADFLTSDTIANSTIIDFSTQPTQTSVAGPIQIGDLVGEDIEFSGSPNTGLYAGVFGWGLLENGSWGSPMTYVAGNDARTGTLIFEFNDLPVSAVGGFMNHIPSRGELIISVLDSNQVVLETYNVSTLAEILTPGGVNEGAFRGIDRGNSEDISFFVVEGYVPVLDDLTFTRDGQILEINTTPVPALSPFALVLLLLMIAFTGLVAFRRTTKT